MYSTPPMVAPPFGVSTERMICRNSSPETERGADSVHGRRAAVNQGPDGKNMEEQVVSGPVLLSWGCTVPTLYSRHLNHMTPVRLAVVGGAAHPFAPRTKASGARPESLVVLVFAKAWVVASHQASPKNSSTSFQKYDEMVSKHL